MSNNEAPKNREAERDDPGAMWGGEEWPPFKGKVAEAKQPKSYRMEITKDMRSGGTLISREAWKQWFYDKDKGTNKDETYFNKMLSAIDAWNSLSADEREDFLATGDYTEDVSEDLISLLTSSGIIDFAEPSIPPRGGGGGHGGGHGGGEGHTGGGHGGGEGHTGGGHTGGEGHTGGDGTGTGEGPIGGGESGDGADGTGEAPIGGGESGDGSGGTDGEGISDGADGEDGDDGNTGEGDSGDNTGDEGDEGSTGETDGTGDGGDATDDGGKKPKKKRRIWDWIFGGRKKKKPGDDDIPTAQPSGGGDDEPGDTKPKPERDVTDDIDTVLDDPIEASDASEEEKKKFRVVLKEELKELPAEQQKEILETAKKERSKLIDAAKVGLPVLLSLLLLMNPFVPTTETGHIEGNSVRTEHVLVEDGHVEHMTIPGEDRVIEHEVTRREVVPVDDLQLGEVVQLEPGLELHYTSDRRDPSFEGHGKYITKKGENYQMNRIAVYDKDGNLLGTRHLPQGDSGTVSEFIQQICEEHNLAPDELGECFYHYATENGGDLGWTDAATVITETTETVTITIPGEDTTVDTYVPATYEDRTVETSFSGKISDSKAGSVEITNEDGSTTTINIRDVNGNLLQPGETVIGADGNTYTIESVSDAESGTRIDALRVAHDIAVLGTGVAVAILIARKKKHEGEDGGETESGEGAETTGTEAEAEVVRERYIIEMTGDELRRTADVFTQLARDDAQSVAENFAKNVGVNPEEIDDKIGEPGSDNIYTGMTPPERTVVYTLLTHLHDPSTLYRLADALGVDHDEFIDSIGIDTSGVEIETEEVDTSDEESEEA